MENEAGKECGLQHGGGYMKLVTGLAHTHSAVHTAYVFFFKHTVRVQRFRKYTYLLSCRL